MVGGPELQLLVVHYTEVTPNRRQQSASSTCIFSSLHGLTNCVAKTKASKSLQTCNLEKRSQVCNFLYMALYSIQNWKSRVEERGQNEYDEAIENNQTISKQGSPGHLQLVDGL